MFLQERIESNICRWGAWWSETTTRRGTRAPVMPDTLALCYVASAGGLDAVFLEEGGIRSERDLWGWSSNIHVRECGHRSPPWLNSRSRELKMSESTSEPLSLYIQWGDFVRNWNEDELVKVRRWIYHDKLTCLVKWSERLCLIWWIRSGYYTASR